MALLILPLGVILGLVVWPPKRAAWYTVAVGVGALAVLGGFWVSDTEVSPWESLMLAIGTPVAAWLAFAVSKPRRRIPA
jgi:hypothetical protein